MCSSNEFAQSTEFETIHTPSYSDVRELGLDFPKIINEGISNSFDILLCSCKF